jgi:hypothetical protein
MEWQLTDKANFPENDLQAAQNLSAALGIMMEFMDNFVRSVNEDDDVLNLWDIGRGLQASADLYYSRGSVNEV